MKSLRWLASAFVLSCISSIAWADEPSLADWAKGRIDEGLVKPLTEKESARKAFSRSRPPPGERRVRITAASTTPDEKGNAYVPFAIDVRFGSDAWNEDDIVGCTYRGSGHIFVKIGEEYRPAAFLLGKNVKPVAGVCRPGADARS